MKKVFVSNENIDLAYVYMPVCGYTSLVVLLLKDNIMCFHKEGPDKWDTYEGIDTTTATLELMIKSCLKEGGTVHCQFNFLI